MTPIVTTTKTIQSRLAASRRRALFGRDVQLSMFDAMLDPDGRRRLWFVTGPLGIGKTTLLQAFRDRALERGGAVAFADAHSVRPNPPAMRHALERAAGDQSLAAFCTHGVAPVLLIDRFEKWRDMACWWQEQFLPQMPSHLRIVFAALDVFDSDWQQAARRVTGLRNTTLDDLRPDDAAAYLTARGVDRACRQTLLTLAGGRPLALALGADVVARAGLRQK